MGYDGPMKECLASILRDLMLVLSCTFFALPATAGEIIQLELDSASFSLRPHDGGSGESGPSIPVALGSPEQATPRGEFWLDRVILRPSWYPGPSASEAGALPEGASIDSPMGVAKIPFANEGLIALHGGGDPRVLGKPVSSGCVRASDADILHLIAWLDLHEALAPPSSEPGGEVIRRFRRPVRLIVR